MKIFQLHAGRWFKWSRGLLQGKSLPLGRYVILAALISSVPVSVITTLAVLSDFLQINADTLVYSWPFRNHPTLAFIMGLADILLMSPLVETGLALLPIWFFRKVRLPEHLIPIFCGLLWGLAHCRGGSWFPIVQAWPFFCFTLILITHERPSIDRAWLIASAVHALNNVITFSVSVILANLP